MPHRGLEIAIEHGKGLPSFRSQEEADQTLFGERDRHLAILSELAEGYPAFESDYRPESLKTLEHWYFTLVEDKTFRRIGVSRKTFETCMAMYFGECVVRNTPARWIVEEYFLSKGRYELGVQNGSMKMMLDRLTDHFAQPDNLRHVSLSRRFRKYFKA
jgi:hypothetical protein